ncbi:MAG TPA: VWA domain-containing protein, partial [Gemmataceae bacterium]|nr:VWA domain-containing protein [Gemmataceae bacterium]
MTAKIHIERMMHRTSVSVAGDSVASYALLKLIPTGEVQDKPIGLNLALVLDVSGSMYEEDGTGKSRLNRIQSAAMSALNMLQPNDTLALVAFGHDAQVILPATKLSDRDKIEEVIERVDRHDVDPGGTSMDQGLTLAMQEVEKNAGAGRLTQIVVLTDGETSGEQMCRQIAQQAGAKNIHLTLMGIGTEWNAGLLKDMAQLAEGKWYYIDVSQADDAERAFQEEFGHLSQAGFTNV